MRGRTGGMAAALSALALVAAAGGGGGGSQPEPATSQGGGTGGEVSIRSCTPQNPLIPANTNEVCGGNLLDAIDAKLVHYNADTAAPELDIAESIETKDNQTFTVKLTTPVHVLVVLWLKAAAGGIVKGVQMNFRSGRCCTGT